MVVLLLLWFPCLCSCCLLKFHQRSFVHLMSSFSPTLNDLSGNERKRFLCGEICLIKTGEEPVRFCKAAVKKQL